MPRRFHIETLGCPKNAVDSDKVVASLLADGLVAARGVEDADLVVVNTCAFIESARLESVEVALELSAHRKPGAKLVVTGCMAERYGQELRDALPEADAVVGFAGEGDLATAVGVTLKRKPTGVRDLLELPRPAPTAPWAYVKVAEGCDRTCAFCAIPSFRGAQRSRRPDAIVAEARSLVDGGVAEIVLVAQDLASYGRDTGEAGALVPLLESLDELRPSGLSRVRLLYLYPSEVREPLVSTMLDLPSVVPYFDLSLQHASKPLLRRMRRWGDPDRFLAMIASIRDREPTAAFRSSFHVGLPGETEEDHDVLLQFVAAAELDWAGLFPFSREDGTRAAELDGEVDDITVGERLREVSEIQDRITESRRDELVGSEIEVLIDTVEGDKLTGRSHREAPEIDGVVHLTGSARPGAIVRARVTAAFGPDLDAEGAAA